MTKYASFETARCASLYLCFIAAQG
jgi:hypothetical protein